MKINIKRMALSKSTVKQNLFMRLQKTSVKDLPELHVQEKLMEKSLTFEQS